MKSCGPSERAQCRRSDRLYDPAGLELNSQLLARNSMVMRNVVQFVNRVHDVVQLAQSNGELTPVGRGKPKVRLLAIYGRNDLDLVRLCNGVACKFVCHGVRPQAWFNPSTATAPAIVRTRWCAGLNPLCANARGVSSVGSPSHRESALREVGHLSTVVVCKRPPPTPVDERGT